MIILLEEGCHFSCFGLRIIIIIRVDAAETVQLRERNIIFTFAWVGGLVIDDFAKDGGEEFCTKMHCVLITNP